MKLAIAQTVLGVLIVGNYAVFVYPVGFRFALFLYIFPSFNVFFVLGLGVLGCGIAQLLKARG